MKNNSLLFILSILFSLSALTFSCSSGGDGGDNNGGGGSQQVIPSNLDVNVTIQGQSDVDPFGDGSGVFSVTATATNAVRYGFKVGNSGTETQNTTGLFSYTITQPGISQFPLYVYAYSETDDRISDIEPMKIFVAGNGGSGNNDVLVWFDEFNGTGAVDSSKWVYDTVDYIGNGWGNGEEQTYTNSTDNVIVEDGSLKINVYKTTTGYTSGRIKTKGKKEFTYGRIDIRAKLPTVQGSWPALWMLGANIDDVSWPQCGEIDIMEQFENKNSVDTTLHWYNPSNVNADNPLGQASYGQSKSGSSYDDWHIYTLDWTSSNITAYVDDVEFFSMSTSSSSLPFNQNFFLLFNVAMGGTNGGTIDPNLSTGYVDTMEVDYIRLYQ